MTHESYGEMARRRNLAAVGMSRRQFVGRAAGAAVAASSVAGLLAACGGSSTTTAGSTGGGGTENATLHEIGLSLTEDPRILGQAQQETGIQVIGKSEGLGSQITFWNQNYGEFDINQVNFNQLGAIADTLQTIPVSEVPAWNNELLDLFLRPGAPGYNKKSGWPIAGTYTPQAIKSGKFDELKGIPTWFGFDAFGYIDGKAGGDLTSYGAIFDPANKGKSTLFNEPIVSVMKVATYLSGTGQFTPKGAINNLTKEDLETVFEFLEEKKGEGQFRLFWTDFGQLVELLNSGELYVGDFWASACAAAVESGTSAVFVNDPTEGSNGWIQGMAVSKETPNLKAVTNYANWNLESGVTGAILGTQGYYSPRPGPVQPRLEEEESPKSGVDAWDYWYEGAVPKERPALSTRLQHVADWQAYPDEYPEYSRLWTKFTAA